MKIQTLQNNMAKINQMFFGIVDPRTMDEQYAYNVAGYLTNANIMLDAFGPDKTIEEMTKEALKHCHGVPVFMAIHGKNCDELVDLALRIRRLDPEHVGCKILANPEGFKAIEKLSKMGMKVIVTGLYTVGQAIMAAQAGAYAISPFIHRGIDMGLDMETNIKTMREIYDHMENAPLILTASIRDWNDLEMAIRCGSDAFAAYDLIQEAMTSQCSKDTEISFGKAFAQMKGDDLSYLGIGKNEDTNFVE